MPANRLGVVFRGQWEIGAADSFFSRPTHIAARVAEWVTTGSRWPHLGATRIEASLAIEKRTSLAL